jgi:PKD repeat protein
VQVFAGTETVGAPVQAIEVQASNGVWAGTLAGLAPGPYVLRAQQTDAAGNLGASAAVPITLTAPPASPPPSASFTWFPEVPRVGETVTLVSSSTDVSSPLTAFAWALTGTEPFHAGLPTTTTTFATAGPHVVRLQVADAAGRTATAAKTINVRHQALSLMQPFPIVRIAGRETTNGVKLTLVTVSAPVSALVTVRIRGTGVRSSSQSRLAAAGKRPSPNGTALLSFPRFARSLKAGTVLEIRVTKAGEIGKLTRFVPRRGKLPTRTDLCLSSAGKPMSCPAP